MQEELLRLKAVQGLDNELRTLTSRADEIPERIEKLRSESANARRELEETEAALTEHKKQYKLCDLELKTADEKAAHYSVQLYSAKTNEQYKAFLKEIEGQKKLKSQVEDRMIVLLEETEQLEQKRVQAGKLVARFAIDNERKIGLLEAEQAELRTAIEERQANRQKVLESLPANISRLYHRVLTRNNGIAVVSSTDERCNGCFNPIPPQRVVEIQRRDKIYTCEACGRILLPTK